jgi:hypothetical protein
MRVAPNWAVYFSAVGIIVSSYFEPALKPLAKVVAAGILAITTANLLLPRISKWRGVTKA